MADAGFNPFSGIDANMPSTPSGNSGWAQQLFANNPVSTSRYNFTPLNYQAPSFSSGPSLASSLIPSNAGSSSSSPTAGTTSSGGFWGDLWNNLKTGTENYILHPLGDVAQTLGATFVDPFAGRNVFQDYKDIWTNPSYDNKAVDNAFGYMAKPGETIATAVMDPFATQGGIGNRLSTTLSDIGKLWSSPVNDVTKNVVAKNFQGNQLLNAIGISPQAMGTGVDFVSSLLSPTGAVGKTLGTVADLAKPGISALNTSLRGETGLQDAISTARANAAESQTDAFHTNLLNQQMQEAVNSANKGNFSLADMLNRSPQAQQAYLDEGTNFINPSQRNAPSLANLLNNQTREGVESANNGNFNIANMLQRTPANQEAFLNQVNDMQYRVPQSGNVPNLSDLMTNLTKEGTQSANQGNLSLANMLQRSPEAQQAFLDQLNTNQINSVGGKGPIPTLSYLGKLQQPVEKANPDFTNALNEFEQQGKDYNNAVKQMVQQAINDHNQNSIISQIMAHGGIQPSDRFGTELKELPKWLQLQVIRKSGIPIDSLATELGHADTSSLIDALRNNMSKSEISANAERDAHEVLSPVAQAIQESANRLGEIPQTITKPYGEWKGINPFEKQLAKESNGIPKDYPASNPSNVNKYNAFDKQFTKEADNEPSTFKNNPSNVNKYDYFGNMFNRLKENGLIANNEPFTNKYADVFNKDLQDRLLQSQVDNAKGTATLRELSKNAEGKNILQSAYSKTGDTLAKMFNLPATLGDRFGDYYKFLSNRDYRANQMDKDLTDFVKTYDPKKHDYQNFILARDAGEIGQGHPLEAMNRDYEALLNKYTGQDLGSGLERGTLSNYVPRIADVDKENSLAARRSAMGSDSLGGFKENRTDSRTLRQIQAEDGRIPYKTDLVDITRARLQASINAQESRNFVNSMVSNGRAVKFDNLHKAESSSIYKKGVTGLYVDPLTKETYLMEKPIADFLNRENDFRDAGNFLKTLDSVNSLAKRLTITNPAIHFPHNILSSLPNALRKAGASPFNIVNPSFWKQAVNADPALLDEMDKLGLLHHHDRVFGDTASADIQQNARTSSMNPLQRWGSDILHEASTGSFGDRISGLGDTVFRPLDAMTWGPEQASKVAVYKTARDMGASPEQAAEILNNNFGTNTKTLTPFEKNIMQRAFTFYPWLKHIGSWGTKQFTNGNADVAMKTLGTLNQLNMDLSGHPQSDNPPGYTLRIDTGQKDAKGHEVFKDPYLPILELAKMFQDPATFAYNRLNPSISTPVNELANKQYGLMSPIDMPIVDQAKADAGLQNPTADRINYALQKLFPNPFKPVMDAANSENPALTFTGIRSSSYNPQAQAASDKYRGEAAARALESALKKSGQPIPPVLKKQMNGKVPFPITGQ